LISIEAAQGSRSCYFHDHETFFIDMNVTLAQSIDALLPQTQCTKCGYAGCMPYAEAIASGDAPINRCPPGGNEGIASLAKLLGQPIMALDLSCGENLPHSVAVIDEEICIGCAKCLKACPTDAIIGANKFMHAIIPELCTGCDLCIPPCPVDCIDMIEDQRFPQPPAPDVSRSRFAFHNLRLAREQSEREAFLAAKEHAVLGR
jgi:Na+-translocating ferredoxin:NAD+ oxidoreductase subunit B